MTRPLLNSPEGMKSYLSGPAGEIEEIRKQIEEVFIRWGYKPVITPTLEYYDSLLVGMGQSTRKEFYKLIDYDGNILALRPEMTAPIARTVAHQTNGFELPLRFSYFAPVFRYDSPQMGKNREIFQMGVEFIGEDNLADAEVIIIAIEAIKNAGIENFKLDLGHTGFIAGILSQFGLKEQERIKFKSLLNQKDFVGLNEYINSLKIEDDGLLLKLPHLRGSKEILQEAGELVKNKTSLRAVEELKETYQYLCDYDVAGYVNFDLGLNRGLNYYTGLVFEGFTEKLGYTICGGGRYDKLLGQYGEREIPAVGFALGVERIRLALKNDNYRFTGRSIDKLIIYSPQISEQVLSLVKFLHKQGYSTNVRQIEEINEGLLGEAAENNIREIISLLKYKDEDIVEIIELETGNKRKIKTEAGKGWEILL